MIKEKEIRNIRRLTLIFMVCLALSGLTAFPLKTESEWLIHHIFLFPGFFHDWIKTVYYSIQQSPDVVLYGTDWLAFGHLIISLFFIGVYIDPVRYQFNITVGIIACLAVFPLAFFCGPIRGIPFFHQIIDCCFGVIGLIPLIIILKKIKNIDHEQED